MSTAPQSYMDRNSRWLMPMIAMFLIFSGSVMMTMFAEPGEEPPIVIPKGLYYTALILGGLLAGYGAKMTDTTSARIVELLAYGAGVGAILFAVFG